MNYNQLTAQISEYANRTDQFFTSNIPNFIKQGIERIYSEAKNIGFETILEGQIAAGDTVIEKDALWRENISFELIDTIEPDKSRFLWLRPFEFCREFWPNATSSGVPEFYADTFNQQGANPYGGLYIVPTPARNYNYRWIYLGLPVFNQQNPTNFLTERYSRLLFYACFLEAMPFLKDDERLPQIEALYASALTDINRDTVDRHSDRTYNRNKE